MQVTIDIQELRKRRLFIATPMYGGMCHGEYTDSSVKLAFAAAKYGLHLQYAYYYNESLITRARNYLADEFLRSDCTHLMFIDSDIGFSADDVLMLAAIAEPGSDREILCGPYPKKVITWDRIKQAVEQGYAQDNPRLLERFVGDYVLNRLPGVEFKTDSLVEVLEGGTGFMMIQRCALEKFRTAYPQLLYRPDHIDMEHFDGSNEIMAFFDCVIDPKTRRYLSEDYMFCQWAREAGMKIWLCPSIHLSHTGSYRFAGSMVDFAHLDSGAARQERSAAPDNAPAMELRFR